MKTQHNVLLVEDHEMTAKLYKKVLSNEPISLTHLETGNAALTHLNTQIPDIMLLDLGLPDMSGIDILKSVHEQKCIVIVITAEKAVDIVVEAMRYGAFDFIEKPCQNNRLLITLRNAIQKYDLSQQVEFYEKSCKRQQYYGFIGASKAMQMIYQIIDNVATSKASILVTGESGTGKELCTEAIYQESKLIDKPFVVCNCAAIPEKLMESHLFGHVKGAFTGAVNDQLGLVSQADGGTLFLDEIGELPMLMQSTLLRFVQTKTFSKVGSHKLEQVNIRLICATNKNLLANVQAGEFREDLYYRINTIEIKLPALREREQDILLLAKFVLRKFVEEEQKDFQEFTAEAEQQLLSYDWPGNVRQLQNTIHNLVVLNTGKVITNDMITAKLGEKTIPNIHISNIISTNKTSDIITVNRFCHFKEIEKEVLLKGIKYCDGNVTQTAKLLGISKATLFNKLKLYKNAA